MKKLSGVAVVTTAEGERVSYTYMELDDNGNITSQNNRASFVALDEGLEKCRERAAVKEDIPHD